MRTREEINEQVGIFEDARERMLIASQNKRGFALARIQGYVDALKWTLSVKGV